MYLPSKYWIQKDLFVKGQLKLKISINENPNTKEEATMKNSAFRAWLQNLWQDHQTEVKDWEGKPVEYSMEYWIKKHKWFLKSMYQNKK